MLFLGADRVEVASQGNEQSNFSGFYPEPAAPRNHERKAADGPLAIRRLLRRCGLFNWRNKDMLARCARLVEITSVFFPNYRRKDFVIGKNSWSETASIFTFS